MPVIAGGANAETVRFAGIDLKATYGVYAEVMDGLASLPPVRGQNLLVPYQTGTRWAQKYYGERPVVITGQMISVVNRADFYTKLDGLKQLLQLGGGEQKLEIQRQDGTFRYVMAEVRNTLGLQWLTFPTKASPFSIEFIASDPFWYSSVLAGGSATAPWTLDSGVFLDDGAHWLDSAIGALFAQTLTQQVTQVVSRNGGSGLNRRPIFTLTGSSGDRVATNPTVYNATNGYWIQILAQPFVNQPLVIDCGRQKVTLGGYPLPASQVVLGVGQTDWMHLEVGDNSLQIDLGIPIPAGSYAVLWTDQHSHAYL